MTDRTEIETPLSPGLGVGGTLAAKPYRPSRFMRFLLSVAHNVRLGSLTVVLPDGSRHAFQGREPGPDGVWLVHDDRVARRMLFGGILGFCESYLDGDWTSPDTPALFEMALRNQTALWEVLRGKGWLRFASNVAHRLRPNSRSGSRKNIAYHYDLGNEFYRRWLDETMTYSAAVFADPAAPEALSEAQWRKYAELAKRLDLKPGQHVLEIGCGWGGFAEFAAREVGARVTGITISQAQHDFAARRIQQAGLADKVEIRLQDYRDTRGQFDRIASIEMFEAVGEKYWPHFFETVRDRLAEGGRAALQVITIAEQHFERYRTGGDYIQRYIFPGGMLPTPTHLRDQVQRAGLRWLDATGFGRHYARTLSEWQIRFQAAWPELSGMGFDTRFKRMWEQYLWYCEAGFQTGHIDVLQLAVARD